MIEGEHARVPVLLLLGDLMVRVGLEARVKHLAHVLRGKKNSNYFSGFFLHFVRVDLPCLPPATLRRRWRSSGAPPCAP